MGTKLYVSNLALHTTEDTLKARFGAEGRSVQTVTIVKDEHTGVPAGYAFVEMENRNDARAAIVELDGEELDGRRIRVNEARERRK